MFNKHVGFLNTFFIGLYSIYFIKIDKPFFVVLLLFRTNHEKLAPSLMINYQLPNYITKVII